MRTLHKSIYLLTLLLFILCGVLCAQEGESENEEGVEKEVEREELQSIAEERQLTLRFGIDEQILPVLESITAEGDEIYQEDVLSLLGLSLNPRVRTAAFAYLEKIENEKAVEAAEAIVAEFEDTQIELLRAAMSYLAAVKKEITLDFIRPLLQSEEQTALAALKSFREREIEGLAELLLEMFEDKDSSEGIKQEIILTFGKLGDPAPVSMLEEIALDEGESNTLRHYACSSLGEIGSVDSLPVLLQVYGSNDAIMRSYALYGISKLDDKRADEILIGALRDSYWKIRVFACEGIGEKKLGEAVPILQFKAEKDPEIPVRRSAVQALVVIGSAKAMETVQNLFKDEKVSAAIRITALESMVEHTLNESIPVIKEVFDNELAKKTPILLDTICGILSKQEEGNLADFYKKMLAHPSMTVQIHALRGIRLNKMGQFREQVEKLTEDHMPASLRKHAKMTLDAM